MIVTMMLDMLCIHIYIFMIKLHLPCVNHFFAFLQYVNVVLNVGCGTRKVYTWILDLQQLKLSVAESKFAN